jgi:hypothetical protein
MNVQMTTSNDKYTQNIHNSSTRSHASEEENPTKKSQQKLEA